MSNQTFHSDNQINTVQFPSVMNTYSARINLPQMGAGIIYTNRPSQPRLHVHHIQLNYESYTKALLRIPPPDDEPASDESEVEVIEENKMKVENEITISNEKFDKEMCEINLEEEEEPQLEDEQQQQLKKSKGPSVVELTTTIENLIEFGDETPGLIENSFHQFDLLSLFSNNDEDKNALSASTNTNNSPTPTQEVVQTNKNPFNSTGIVINTDNNTSNTNNNPIASIPNNNNSPNNSNIFNSTNNTNSPNTANTTPAPTPVSTNAITNDLLNNNIPNNQSNPFNSNPINSTPTPLPTNATTDDIFNNNISNIQTNPFNSQTTNFNSSNNNNTNNTNLFSNNEQIFAAFDNYNKTKNIKNDLLSLDLNGSSFSSTSEMTMANKTSFSTGNINKIDDKNSLFETTSSSIDELFVNNVSKSGPDYRKMYEEQPDELKRTLLRLDNFSLSTALYMFMSTEEKTLFILSLARDSGTKGTRLLSQIPSLPPSSMNDYIEQRKQFAMLYPMFEGNFSLYDFTQKNKGKSPPTPGNPPISVDVAKHLIKDLELFLTCFADHQKEMVIAEDGYDAFQALSYIIAKLRSFNIQKGFVNSSTIPLYKNLHRRITEAFNRAQININFPSQPFNFDDEMILKKLRAPKHRDLFEQL